MRHFYLLVFFTLIANLRGIAQEVEVSDTTYWTNNLSIGLNFSQASFSENWKAGGVNSVAIGAIVSGSANYKKAKLDWTNEFELQYGIVNNEGQGNRKSVDRILLDSKIGYDISKNWNGFFSANFLTQFAQGFRYEENANGDEEQLLISNFMAPGFLTTSLGFEFKPSKVFWMRLSPFSPRFTFVSDTTIYRNVPSNYGVEIGETLRTEWLAASVTANFEKEIFENVSLKSRYSFFANYEQLAFSKIDHRLDIVITAKVNSWLNVNFNSIMLYDIDQDADLQLSQLLAVGLLYSIKNTD